MTRTASATASNDVFQSTVDEDQPSTLAMVLLLPNLLRSLRVVNDYSCELTPQWLKTLRLHDNKRSQFCTGFTVWKRLHFVLKIGPEPLKSKGLMMV